jgi:hypothetical protein
MPALGVPGSDVTCASIRVPSGSGGMAPIFRAVAQSRRSKLSAGLLAIGFLALATPVRALASSPLRLVASSTVNFSTDGERYAAWESRAGGPLTVLDTRHGRRTQVTLPVGCHLGNDYSDPGATERAAGGRFLLSCVGERNRVFDVRTGASELLAAGTGWLELGMRYAQGISADEHQVVENLATGTVKRTGEPGAVDLDRAGAPGLSAICPRLRRAVRREAPSEGRSAYRSGRFVRPLGERGAVIVHRCNGAARILAAGSLPHGAFERHKPCYFDLRSGLLTWDTGEPPDGDYAELGEPRLRSRLFAFRLSSGRLDSWRLPRTAIKEGKGTLPAVAAGYATHTAHAVFWVATRTTLPGNAFSSVSTTAIYSAQP